MQQENSGDHLELSAIVQSSDDAIISKRFDGTITSWNAAAEKIFGYTAEEAIGKHISLIIPDELLSEEDDIISKVKSGEKIEHYETTRKKKDGSTISISLTVSPIKDENENVVGASKIARDITMQKSFEEKQAMLAAIVDSSDDAIVSKDLNGFITSWNQGAEKIFGYTESEIVGKHITTLIPEERLDEETMIIGKIRKGERLTHFETVRKRKDGRLINVSLTTSPIKDKNGKIIGASKIARDITEKIEIEHQRQLYTEKLQELNNYKDEFMAMASHELKTPLTVIKANLQILQHLMKENTNSDFLQKTIKQVNKLNTLITDLLDVSKIQTGKLELNPATFEINTLLKEIISNIQQTTLEHKIDFITANEELFATGDRERLEQVVINVLTNAIKYSPNSESVVVKAVRQRDKIIVSITDTGIGIPNEDLDKIFTRFYRVRGLASTFSGSGIGLYISSEIIKRHGGEMWVESEEGKGSTFYFSVPAAEK